MLYSNTKSVCCDIILQMWCLQCLPLCQAYACYPNESLLFCTCLWMWGYLFSFPLCNFCYSWNCYCFHYFIRCWLIIQDDCKYMVHDQPNWYHIHIYYRIHYIVWQTQFICLFCTFLCYSTHTALTVSSNCASKWKHHHSDVYNDFLEASPVIFLQNGVIGRHGLIK